MTVPPTAPRRSAIPTRPEPWPGPVAGDETGPVVDHREPQLAVDQRQLDVDQGLRRVLGGVLQRLEAGEVDGGLDGHRQPPGRDLGGDPDPDVVPSDPGPGPAAPDPGRWR